MNEKSRMCSCIFCHETMSHLGINTHYHQKHSSEPNKELIASQKKASETFQLNNFDRNVIKWKDYYTDPKHCQHCGVEMNWFLRNNKFCSSSCAASFNNTGRIKHGKMARKPCEVCSTITENPRFCSKKCFGIGISLYKTDAEKKNAKKLASRIGNARYRARMNSQTPVDVDREAIRLFYANCPPGYHVDHIIPISKGGLHTIENLQYLTAEENIRKSNKLNWSRLGDSNPP